MLYIREVPEGSSLWVVDTSPIRSPHNLKVIPAEVRETFIETSGLKIPKTTQVVFKEVQIHLNGSQTYYFLTEKAARISLNLHIQKLLEKRIRSYSDIIRMDSLKLSEIEEELREFKENNPEMFI